MEILDINYFYIHDRPQNSYVPEHNHQSYELLYYIKGKGQTTCNGITHKFKKGTILLYKPDEPHDEMHLEYAKIYNFRFSMQNSDFCPQSGAYLDENNNVLNKMEQIITEMKEKRTNYNVLMSLFLSEILIILNRMTSTFEKDQDPFSYVKQFINENFHAEIDLRKLADITGYSYDRFRHLFKENTGLSPGQYILQAQIENAKTALKNKSAKISDVAVSSGFFDFSQFSAIFKKHTGQSPSDYQKSIDKN